MSSKFEVLNSKSSAPFSSEIKSLTRIIIFVGTKIISRHHLVEGSSLIYPCKHKCDRIEFARNVRAFSVWKKKRVTHGTSKTVTLERHIKTIPAV